MKLREVNMLVQQLIILFFGAFFSLSLIAAEEKYSTSREMHSELEKLANEFPKITRSLTIGHSHEGKPIHGLQISSDLKTASSRPAILITGGIHGRELAAAEVTMGVARLLLKNHSTDPRLKSQFEKWSIWIFPLINPDAKDYNLQHRLDTGYFGRWRKNRRPLKDSYIGVDINRNFDFFWGNTSLHTSKNPSSDTYMGPSVESEPETKALVNFINNNPNITALLDIHASSPYVIYPWGHTKDTIKNKTDLDFYVKTCKAMGEILDYRVIQSGNFGPAYGVFTDWAYYAHGIYSIVVEAGSLRQKPDELKKTTDLNYLAFLQLMGDAPSERSKWPR